MELPNVNLSKLVENLCPKRFIMKDAVSTLQRSSTKFMYCFSQPPITGFVFFYETVENAIPIIESYLNRLRNTNYFKRNEYEICMLQSILKQLEGIANEKDVYLKLVNESDALEEDKLERVVKMMLNCTEFLSASVRTLGGKYM